MHLFNYFLHSKSMLSIVLDLGESTNAGKGGDSLCLLDADLLTFLLMSIKEHLADFLNLMVFCLSLILL